MTIVVDNPGDTAPHIVEANLHKMVNVIDVQDVSNVNAIFRELALIKVQCTPDRRAEVLSLVNIFNASVESVGSETMVVQITASEDQVNSLVELLRPIGIKELVRTGHVAMMRGMSDGVRHSPGSINGRVVVGTVGR